MEMNFKKLCGYVVGPALSNPLEYCQLIVALTFLMNTHPDICFDVNTLSQLVTEPLHADWVIFKHILRYFHGTISLGLRYTTCDVQLHEYTNADWIRIFI